MGITIKFLSNPGITHPSNVQRKHLLWYKLVYYKADTVISVPEYHISLCGKRALKHSNT